MEINNCEVSNLIAEYLEHKQWTLYFHNKMKDAEKEYNKLITISGGEERKFSLEEASDIYKVYKQMQFYSERQQEAESKFNEADQLLRSLGEILFQGTITADITIPPVNGEMPVKKMVTVSFPYGQVLVV